MSLGRLWCIVGIVLVGVSPSRSTTLALGNLTKGCVTDFNATVDYFPEKATIEDAVNFSVEYRRWFKVVTVKQAFAAGTPERYVLVQCGTPAPPIDGELDGAQIVSVPAQSLFSTSTTHLQLLVDLDRLDVLTGVSRLRHLTGDALIARATSGQVTEFAPVSVVDAELIVSKGPSLLMTGGAATSTLPAIRAAGIPVVANTEWLEPTALARAEWLKYVALFLNEERVAQQLHGAMKARYRALRTRALAQPEPTRPLVMTGRSDRGTFTIAGGRSYVASLIADAGGRYAWTDNAASGAASVDLEAQIVRAATADIWINGGGWRNRAGMLENEPRYTAFTSFRQGQVWVYEKRVTPSGSNDYWSRSISHPDLVLADLIKIFHPSILPNHELEWYQQVPAK